MLVDGTVGHLSLVFLAVEAVFNLPSLALLETPGKEPGIGFTSMWASDQNILKTHVETALLVQHEAELSSAVQKLRGIQCYIQSEKRHNTWQI